MKTPLGKYLEKHKSNRSKIAVFTGITEDRLNALSNENTAILYADEFYQVLFVANFYAGIPAEKFDDSVSEIFPDRKKGILVDKYNQLSPTAKLFSIYTQSKKEVERAVGMPKNKISKLGTKGRATALEVINFCDGMNLGLLEMFQKLFGKIEI